MAAGIGSRFGGTKQLAQVGPDGEAFLDFSILDAVAAGAMQVVLIVRSDIEDDIRRHVEQRHAHLDVAYVRQDEHGPPRAKPWGTAHAALAAAPAVHGPFMVCNADDYYGESTYLAVAERMPSMGPDQALLPGFQLSLTLPAQGTVSRGICSVDNERLLSVIEHHGIARRDGTISATDPVAELADDTMVSMNLWAFPPAMFDWLDEGFERFIADHGVDDQAEFLLPSAVTEKMFDGSLSVGVVPTEEAWIGVTNPGDLAVAQRTIAQLRT